MPYCSETSILFEDLQAFHIFLHSHGRFLFECKPLFVESLDLSRAIEHMSILLHLFLGLCSLDITLNHGCLGIFHPDYFPLFLYIDSGLALDLFYSLEDI